MSKPITYRRIMSIVHGKSELYICKSFKSNLRLKHDIFAKDKGDNNIEITNILKFLRKDPFANFDKFMKKYDDIETKKGKLLNFRLFIIMDIDDCGEELKQKYITKDMFKEHWLYDYITPIFSDRNLEAAMNEVGIPIIRKSDYFTLFPTSHGDLDLAIAKDYYEKFKKSKCSNLCEYIEYCIKVSEENQIKI